MAGSEARPLAGRRVVVTRAREQAEEFAGRLEELGAEVMFLPMVRFLDVEDASELDRAIAALPEFDWLVFTSANAARFFLKRCRLVGQWPDPEDGPRIAAVGDATRAAAEAENLRVTLVPRESSGAALAAAVGAQAKGKKVLVPRSDLAGDELPGALRAAGAEVTEVVAYRTAETEDIDAATRAMILGGEADAVTFFSPSAFRNFVQALGGPDAVRAMSERAALAAVGPTTAAAIRGAGFEVAVEASEANGASLAAALERYFVGHPVGHPAGHGTGQRAGRGAPRPADGKKGRDHVSH